MIYSMTGYGSAEENADGLDVRVELKSVNNRYLDCNVRLPRSYIFAEETVRSAVAAGVGRGKVDVYVTIDSAGAEDVEIRVNEELARSYADALRRVAEVTGADCALDAASIARFGDVLVTERREADSEQVAQLICRVLNQALEGFQAMREREGEKLREDILNRLNTIEGYIARVEERSPETVREYREKLTVRMQELLESRDVEENRILLEAAIYADKVAVDEETVRLRSHISQMREMLAVGSPVGRKLDFLVQEFNREANTIGSKCSDSGMARLVVDLKAEIEKIREQVQNIE